MSFYGCLHVTVFYKIVLLERKRVLVRWTKHKSIYFPKNVIFLRYERNVVKRFKPSKTFSGETWMTILLTTFTL